VCWYDCTGASAWPSQWVASEIHFIAVDLVTVTFNKMLNQDQGIKVFIIILLLHYGCTPTTMDAVPATFVIGGQAIIKIREVNRNKLIST
jgi:hypothetical protein